MWQREIFNHIGDDGVRSSLNASDLLNTPYLFAPPEEKKKIIRLIRDTHNAYFEAYSRYNVERYDYQIILVNFYMQYLDSMMDFGDIFRLK